MRKMLSFLLSAGFVGLAGNAALAAPSSYDYGASASAGIGIGLIIFWLIFMLISILFFVFWIWMLIDCIKRDFEQKTLWIVLILVLGWIGAIAYYFAVRRKSHGVNSEITPTQTAPPVAMPPTPTPPVSEEPNVPPTPPIPPAQTPPVV
ncbi:MAG: PLD nuclease N-terminal domain-containing protein [bacterium]|nr:PLD nuclease N-terminal domain-containing protein [bacterium]